MYHPTRGGVRGGRDRKLSLLISVNLGFRCFCSSCSITFYQLLV